MLQESSTVSLFYYYHYFRHYFMYFDIPTYSEQPSTIFNSKDVWKMAYLSSFSL